ncbi:hypothetical protein IWX90DRAFT_412290 [Phyllosticta citrichinensis]|uniref:BZIP domain-containing protein n=1 Tax=Phyllosticta citrichinensis TaxID=1130410 RepID=A0ABR1Y3N2_9PEZI
MAKRQADRTKEEQEHKREQNRKQQQASRKRKSEEKKAAERERNNRRYAYTAYLPPNSNELDSSDGLVFPSRNRQIDLLAYEEEMEALLANAFALMDVGHEGYTH